MDDSRLAKLQDAMDSLWFQQNILFSESTGLDLQSFSNRAGNSSSISATPRNSASQSSPASLSKKSNQLNNEEKRPTRLDIVLRQPLFQLQLPARSKSKNKSNICSHPSSLSIDTSLRIKGRRRVRERIRACKSSSELENYELEGCMDLGFVFHREKMSPQMISILPGLQRLGEEGDGSEEKRAADERRVRRPYLSEAWLINRTSLPLLDVWMLPKSPQDGANIKSRLRFWAREVASLVHIEP